jgi:hypothetical protein
MFRCWADFPGARRESGTIDVIADKVADHIVGRLGEQHELVVARRNVHRVGDDAVGAPVNGLGIQRAGVERVETRQEPQLTLRLRAVVQPAAAAPPRPGSRGRDAFPVKQARSSPTD